MNFERWRHTLIGIPRKMVLLGQAKRKNALVPLIQNNVGKTTSPTQEVKHKPETILKDNLMVIYDVIAYNGLLGSNYGFGTKPFQLKSGK